MRALVILAAGLLVASCSPAGGRGGTAASADMAAPLEARIVAPPSPMVAAEAAPKPSTKPNVPAGPPQLAYSYVYGLSVAPRRVAGLVAQHEAACAAAGPADCQVTGSSVSEEGEDRVSGQLTLRATPAWLKRFRASLAGDAKAAGGRLVDTEVTSEDLSRQIVDTEAALKAKTTLRDRLQVLLAGRPGKVSDLLDVERELARVQGELDATQSELLVMKGRVATSDVTLNYHSNGVMAPQGVWAPLAHAFADFLGIIAATLAAMVRFVAWTLPWALLVAGLLWLFRKRLPKLRWPRRKAAPPTT